MNTPSTGVLSLHECFRPQALMRPPEQEEYQAENSLFGVKTAPGLNSEIRLLILLVRLCLLPPRFGGCKTETPQLNRDSQLVLSVGLATIARNTAAKCEAQAGRADFGMCLITGRPEGAHSLRGSKTV